MRVKTLAFILAVASFCFAVDRVEIMREGNRASKELMQTLMSNLKGEIQKSGFVGALEFCSDEAMNITKRVDGNLTNSSIKRISLKNRNPKNAPTQSEAKILELFENLKSNSMELTPMVQKVSESEYKFFKPIVIKKGACLKCHGDDKSIDPKVKESLKKLYPEDKAVGYKLDDIRGAFVVDITIK